MQKYYRDPSGAEIFVFNPLGPHDAMKHHFATLKNDLISYT